MTVKRSSLHKSSLYAVYDFDYICNLVILIKNNHYISLSSSPHRNGGVCTGPQKRRIMTLLSRRGQLCVCRHTGEATGSARGSGCGGRLPWCCRGPGDYGSIGAAQQPWLFRQPGAVIEPEKPTCVCTALWYNYRQLAEATSPGRGKPCCKTPITVS